MFGLLFGKKQKKEITPPTEKQLKYAKMIGVEVTPEMSKWDVSRAIDNKVNSSPKLQRQQRHIERSKRIKQYGEELVDKEDYWYLIIITGRIDHSRCVISSVKICSIGTPAQRDGSCQIA